MEIDDNNKYTYIYEDKIKKNKNNNRDVEFRNSKNK